MHVWHVTPTANVWSILENGLEPRIDKRAAECGETKPGVYVFAHPSDLENALSNWLGDCFEEDEPLSIIQLDVPIDLIHSTNAEYERVVHTLLMPKHIILITPENEWDFNAMSNVLEYAENHTL